MFIEVGTPQSEKGGLESLFRQEEETPTAQTGDAGDDQPGPDGPGWFLKYGGVVFLVLAIALAVANFFLGKKYPPRRSRPRPFSRGGRTGLNV
jgi:hypothetical protein